MTPVSQENLKAAAENFRGDDFPQLAVQATDPLPEACKEAQHAIKVATDSMRSALRWARTLNTMERVIDGKAPNGKWTPGAQDGLRAALLFASAGLDSSLKRLARYSLPLLVDSDSNVTAALENFAHKKIASGPGKSIDAKELVNLLMTQGRNPREIMIENWIRDLESSSAQSADRVHEFALALGVKDSSLLKRIRPSNKATKTLLENSFRERNLISHELDVVHPKEQLRAARERIQKYRKKNDIQEYCYEALEVTQLIVNDVASRLPK